MERSLTRSRLAERAREFLAYACLTYTLADHLRRWQRAASMLARTPDLAGVDIYTAAVASDVASSRGLLDADAGWVSRPGGPNDWAPLLYLTYSRIPDEPPGRDAVAVARLLLDRGADPDAHLISNGRYEFTAITGAIGEGEGGLLNLPPHERARELVELLLKAGANPNDSQGLYNTHFRPGNEWLELLLANGLTATAPANWLEEAEAIPTLDYLLGQAVQAGFEERVRLLLAHGADPNSRNAYTDRPQYENALLNGHETIAELLTAHGATHSNQSHADRFRAACMAADADTARALLAQDTGLIDDPALLMDAVGRAASAAVRLLIKLGADVNRAPRDNLATPLHDAAWPGKDEAAALLLDAGARVDARDASYDSSPIGWANESGMWGTRDLLLDRTRDVFDLVTWGRVDQLRELLEADPSLATRRREGGRTVLHRLEIGGERGGEVIDIVFGHGADLNAKADDGSTPLSTARELDNGVAELLEARGARTATAD